jgi:transposase
MVKELEQFQQEAKRLKQGRKGGALPFPEALRAFAVRYAEQTMEAGGTVVEAAAARLGVSAPTLYEWRKGRPAGSTKRKKRTERSGVLLPVRVGERPAEAAVAGAQQVVVSPSGWRVEGLSVDSPHVTTNMHVSRATHLGTQRLLAWAPLARNPTRDYREAVRPSQRGGGSRTRGKAEAKPFSRSSSGGPGPWRGPCRSPRRSGGPARPRPGCDGC